MELRQPLVRNQVCILNGFGFLVFNVMGYAKRRDAAPVVTRSAEESSYALELNKCKS